MTTQDDAGNPSPNSRFKKGQSGNPKGRPTKKFAAGSGSQFDIIVDRTLTIRKEGNLEEVSIEEALQHRTYLKAIEGHNPSRRAILKMIQKREAFLQKQTQPVKWRVVNFHTEYSEPENANEAMLILGKVTIDEAKLEMNGHNPPVILEPWAVQAALSRRRGGAKLTEREIKDISRCTRDANTINWPRGTGR